MLYFIFYILYFIFYILYFIFYILYFIFVKFLFYNLNNSYIALPKLLEKYKYNYFDFIFIDGFHTFDYTLVDFFFSNLLLKINGIIVILKNGS